MRARFLGSPWRVLARAGAVVFVLVATLRSGGTDLPAGWAHCLACGDLAAAEVVQNLFLFVPFGLAFGLRAAKPARVVLAGFLFSLAVEVVQHRLPGRDPSLADVLFNTMGTAAGVRFALAAPVLLAPPERWAPWLGLASALLATAVLGATGILFQTADQDPAVMRWVPDLPRLPRYGGRVTAAELGPVPLAPGPVPDPAGTWARWAAGEPLDVTLVLGPAPGAFAPIVAIMTAHDERLLVLGAARHDLAVWPRTRAAAWHLDQPDLRLRGALAGMKPGDTVHVTVARQANAYCLGVGAARRSCFAYGIGQGWALVLYPESVPPWLRRLGGLAWLAALAWPAGVWWRRHAASVGAVALLGAAIILAPLITGLRPAGPLEVGAVAAGVALGVLAMRTRLAAAER